MPAACFTGMRLNGGLCLAGLQNDSDLLGAMAAVESQPSLPECFDSYLLLMKTGVIRFIPRWPTSGYTLTHNVTICGNGRCVQACPSLVSHTLGWGEMGAWGQAVPCHVLPCRV